MSLGKGIKISTGFDLNAKTPLDNRQVFETIKERDSLPAINIYEGLHCYVKETQKNYQYINGKWENFASGGEAPTKLSQLTNDVGYLTSIPSEYITEEELEGLMSTGGGAKEIEYSNYPPTDKNILLWVDASSDGVTSFPLLSNEIILEFQGIIGELRTQIDKLKKDNIALERRIAYLEQHGGGGGSIPDYEDEKLIMVFEDGTQMTFEDGSIMIFEEYVGDVTKMTFEDNSIMTFEDDAEMTFKK